ncbi:hypothetical protein EJ03DRAFT_171894 [Teratosphaeria nubilosa]|uniref:Uncharacterized protein n=1 Tax=Teratosphaeria nubilosa TaxID=161662 RepID=A0A6G1LIY3_9PEZI|nr:hypothetical protein EJ03DRAFT_171894 [Teratosphaeria nubilosa]
MHRRNRSHIMPQTKLLLPIAILTAVAAAGDPGFGVYAGSCASLGDNLGYVTFDAFKKHDYGCQSIAQGAGHAIAWSNPPDAAFPCYGYAYGDNACSWEIGKLDGNYDTNCINLGPWVYSTRLDCYRDL